MFTILNGPSLYSIHFTFEHGRHGKRYLTMYACVGQRHVVASVRMR